jgi:uncharacterized membrane protein SpoIIM required for sporulation
VTPVRFEAEYGALWRELEAALDRIEHRRRRKGDAGGAPPTAAVEPERLAALYRRCCEHLALAQARAYPIGMTARLQELTYRAHRLIYQRRDYGAARLKRLLLVDIPEAVRMHRAYVLVAALLFAAPVALVGVAAWRNPQFALHVVDAQHLASFKSMFSSEHGTYDRLRASQTDWSMFGFYLAHNIGLGFQCFAGGIFAGLGSAFFLAYNGAFNGAIAGYLSADGEAMNFFSFVITHSAFELTAAVLSGAAGLRIGHAWLAPGRRRRLDALRHAAAEAVVLMYGVFAMLVVAAGIEAFWSSARWVPPGVKLAVGAVAWAAVIGYLGWQGRALPQRPAPTERPHES